MPASFSPSRQFPNPSPNGARADDGAAAPLDGGTPAAPDQVGVLTLYREMWRHAGPARGWLVVSSTLLVASQLCKLFVPWLAAQAIDSIQHASGGVADAAPWVAAIVAIFAAAWALHGPGRVLERRVALRVRSVLADRLYDHVSHAPLAWHEKTHAAETQHRMNQATHALYDFTQNQFIYLQNTVNLLGPLIALTLLSKVAGALALAGFAVIAMTIVAFDRSLMRLARLENAAERRHAALLLDCLCNVSSLLALRLRGSSRRMVARRLEEVAAPLRGGITITEWKWCAVDLLSVSLTWLLVATYAWHAGSTGPLMLGGIFMIHQYAQQAGGVIGSLATNLQSFARVRTDFASAAPIWAARSAPRPAASVVASDADWKRIDVCDLHFAHEGDTAEASGAPARGGLRNISITLRRGERIALVGASGSGKSTLLRALAGLYQPTRGHLEIDRVALLHGHDLRDHATLIPQEAQVFEASVRENIAFDLDHDDAAIEEAMRISSFDSVLDSLPLGLETPVSRGGFNLSGGQRQRLCLARGVLASRGSSVLLLDEPTSALDPLTEELVYRRIDAAFPDACIVASVHRMSLLAHFDRVVMMQVGEIVDSGSVDEMRARQPLFRRMVGTQQDAVVA